MTTETFIGSAGAWDVAANWSGNRVPQPGDDVSIPGAGGTSTNMVMISTADPVYTIGSLDIDPGSSTQPLYVPELIDTGTLTVTGATTVANGGQIAVGGGGSLNLMGVTMLAPSGEGPVPPASISVYGSGEVTIGTLSGYAAGGIQVTSGTASIAVDDSAIEINIGASGRVAVGQFGPSLQSDGIGAVFVLDGGTLAIGAVSNVAAEILPQTQNVTIGNPPQFLKDYVGGEIDAAALPYQVGDTLQVSQTARSVGPYGYAFTDSYAVLSPQGQTLLTLSNVATLGDPALPTITLSSDLSGGTLISIACYTPEARILTDAGEIAAGNLAIGDQVVTVSGEAKPVIWIGRRSYAGRFLARQPHLLPVRIEAGALGGGLPRRDLLVSPCHAMFLDGLLIPASSLVNGTTIRQESWVERVEYVHIELAEHDVIFAEGAPSETFLNDDSRNVFQNASEFETPYGEVAVTDLVYYAPRVTDGYEVEAIRARLATGANVQAQAA